MLVSATPVIASSAVRLIPTQYAIGFGLVLEQAKVHIAARTSVATACGRTLWESLGIATLKLQH